MTEVAHADAVELFDATKEECGAWWQRHVDSETRPLLIWWPADAPFVYSSRAPYRKDSLLVSSGRRRLVGRSSLRNDSPRGRTRLRRSPNRQANAFAQEPGHGARPSSRGARRGQPGGAAVGNEFSEADVSGGVTSTLGAVRG